MGKTIGKIDNDFANSILLLCTDGHLSCSIDRIVCDIWDCTDETCDVFWIVDGKKVGDILDLLFKIT